MRSATELNQSLERGIAGVQKKCSGLQENKNLKDTLELLVRTSESETSDLRALADAVGTLGKFVANTPLAFLGDPAASDVIAGVKAIAEEHQAAVQVNLAVNDWAKR